MRVLGIESSCDETGIAIYDDKEGLLADSLFSQVKTHQAYGGVVPELASRDHVRHIVSLLDEALREASLKVTDLDAIAYTAGPGLVGALLTGATFAKSLAFSLGVPALAIHHLEAHVLVSMLNATLLKFPFIALLVSGGHTQLILAHGLGQYELLGDTLDDAVGEAFDKCAKLMGFPYPGGAELAKCADEFNALHKSLLHFPRPMTDRPGLDFSFSGLKTHVLTTWQASKQDHEARGLIAASFQDAVVDTLLIKCQRAIKQTGIHNLVVAGGVGANRALRARLGALLEEMNGAVFFPKPEYCTDNGAMVAFTGYLHLLAGEKDESLGIDVRPRWPLSVVE